MQYAVVYANLYFGLAMVVFAIVSFGLGDVDAALREIAAAAISLFTYDFVARRLRAARERP